MYAHLGVRPLINATCHWTDYGGVITWPEVGEAMAAARTQNVSVHELLDRASDVISHYTHADAAYVVSGCSAALLAGAAAIITGDDRLRMAELPHLPPGVRREFVAYRCPRRLDSDGRRLPVWTYAHAIRAAGGHIVEVGDDRGVSRSALASAIGSQTAGVYWLSDNPDARISLPAVVETAHEHGVPVLLDAANTLPPPENIHLFVDQGVDLVAFSGGKGLRGPQGSGFLAGRADLVRAARAQGSPYDGIARALKVSKEEIVGLLTAIETWSVRNHDADATQALRQTEYLVGELQGIAGIRAELVCPDHFGRPYPTCFISIGAELGTPARSVIDTLLRGDPPIAVMDFEEADVVRVDVRILAPSEVETVADRLREVLTALRCSSSA